MALGTPISSWFFIVYCCPSSMLYCIYGWLTFHQIAEGVVGDVVLELVLHQLISIYQSHLLPSITFAIAQPIPNRTPLTTSIAMIRSTNSRTFLLLPFSCPSSLDLTTGWAEPFFRRLTAPDAQMLSPHQLVVVAFGCHRFVFTLLAPALAGKSSFCYPSASDTHVRGFSCLIDVHFCRSLPHTGQ